MLETKFATCLSQAISFSNFLKLAHWNVRGMFFYSYHLLFENLYEKITGHVDVLAELASVRGIAINSNVFIEPPQITSSDVKELIITSLEQMDEYKMLLNELLDELDDTIYRSTIIAVEDILMSLDNVQYLLEASL